MPQWPGGWMLGTPDLVLEMPKPFSVPPDGKDVYRNFVIPVPFSLERYVKTVEFQPDNLKVVHHAFIKLDATRQCRRLDGNNGQPGFEGMGLPEGVQMPEDLFLTWQPGKLPSLPPAEHSWRLPPNSDLILQVHLRPSGKPEVLQCRLGISFTDTPPT